MLKKTFVSLIVLMLSLSLVFSTSFAFEAEKIANLDTGFLYSSIQEAINAPETLNGHTLHVGSGTYNENLIIAKSLTIIGENKENTIIFGDGTSYNVIEVNADNVEIMNFTITSSERQMGIYLKRDFCKISNNIIYHVARGVVDNKVQGTLFKQNYIYDVTQHGINIYGYDGRYEDNTIILTGQVGIYLTQAVNCYLIKNSITNNGGGVGINLQDAHDLWIEKNTIQSNARAMALGSQDGYNNIIFHNNFIDNVEDLWFSIHYPVSNIWDNGYPSGGNYWDKYSTTDQFSGENQDQAGSDGISDVPLVIYGEANIDHYPLMEPWTPPTPEEEIIDLINDVESMNLHQGIDNSLDSKLSNAFDAITAFNADQRNDAINKLEAFINAVEAQRGLKITEEQADYLILKAQSIIAMIQDS